MLIATFEANLAGAVVVFVLTFVLFPTPAGLHHVGRLNMINVIVFVALFAVYIAIAIRQAKSIRGSHMGWLLEGRDPTDRERQLTLRLPLTIQALSAAGWIVAAVLFVALNAPFSAELAGNIGVSIVAGGLVTCALGYLLVERLLRPITALCLASGVPSRPQLPGVGARTLLSWTLSSGVTLASVALIGIGGLHEKRYTAHRVSIAVLVLSAVGIVVGLLIMTGLARSLAEPIVRLRRAAGRVEKGDLDQDVAVDDGSEIGLLQAGFNRMLAGLREREHIRDLFGRQVGEDVVRQALERGVELGGEAIEAAALFVDLEGSTKLAETHDPAEVVSLLNAFFAVVVDVVGAHGGWVNKFEGDAALCVFGAPLENPRAASQALAAARALRERLQAELPDLRWGIGVSAGRVVAGNVGAAKRFEYTVIGDPVNEAARLTELAKSTPELVLASGAALSRSDPAEVAEWRPLEPITLRGRSAPTPVSVPSGIGEGSAHAPTPRPAHVRVGRGVHARPGTT